MTSILLFLPIANVVVSSSVAEFLVATVTCPGLMLIRRCLPQKLETVRCNLGKFTVVAHGNGWLLHRLCTVLCIVGGVLKLGLFKSNPIILVFVVTTLLVTVLNITVWNGPVTRVWRDTRGSVSPLVPFTACPHLLDVINCKHCSIVAVHCPENRKLYATRKVGIMSTTC